MAEESKSSRAARPARHESETSGFGVNLLAGVVPQACPRRHGDLVGQTGPQRGRHLNFSPEMVCFGPFKKPRTLDGRSCPGRGKELLQRKEEYGICPDRVSPQENT